MTSPSIVLLRTQSDARLLALAREGHERAFEAIVERYRRQLLRTCRRVLPEARAEDALQQALLAAWTAVRRGDEVRDLRPWLHRIAHRTALNQLRVSGYDFDEISDALRIADGADDELERRAVMRTTLAGLAALPERQRDALLAIAVEGRSQEEVAHDLGLTSGAVRQLVHRARSSLRAAATAITPLPVVSWAAAAAARSEPMTSRITELSAGAGGASAAATLAKAGSVAVIAGSAITGPAVVERATSHPSPARAQPGSKVHSERRRATVAARHATAEPVAQVIHRAPATPRPLVSAPRVRARSRATGSGDVDDRTAPAPHALPEGSDRHSRHRDVPHDDFTSTSGSGSGSGSAGPGGGDDLAEPSSTPTAEPEHLDTGGDGAAEPQPTPTAEPEHLDGGHDGGGRSGDGLEIDGSGGSGPG